MYCLAKKYQLYEQQGLMNKIEKPSMLKLSEAVTISIIGLKKENLPEKHDPSSNGFS